jgi:hypothetical protein
MGGQKTPMGKQEKKEKAAENLIRALENSQTKIYNKKK